MSSETEQHQHTPRQAAARVARELKATGFVAYFAGGCVRDRLLGLVPKDYDVATDAHPEQITQLFHRTRGVGASFGVILVNLLGHSIEVTTFRADGIYSDNRRPDSIVFADAQRDAARRDFTINGMFEDPETGAIIDYVGGQDDLASGVVRAIGDPEARLSEDRLRMVRAVRFAARFGFDLEPATRAAIMAGAGQLDGVSRERVGQEVGLMLTSPTRARAARLLHELGLDQVILAEQAPATDLKRLSGLPPEAGLATALAAWWLDRADTPQDHRAAPPRAWRRALVMSNQLWADLEHTIERIGILHNEWETLGVAGRKRLACHPAFTGAMEVLTAADPSHGAAIQADVDELHVSGGLPEPLLDGSDLIALGLAPGPGFKSILDAVFDAQLEGRIEDQAQASDLARQLAEGVPEGG